VKEFKSPKIGEGFNSEKTGVGNGKAKCPGKWFFAIFPF
jgi:hypothetical protein